jgi:hypothetical protein
MDAEPKFLVQVRNKLRARHYSYRSGTTPVLNQSLCIADYQPAAARHASVAKSAEASVYSGSSFAG